MLQEIILIIQSLAATSVRDYLLDLVTWTNISEPVLVVKLSFLLLLQLLRNDVLVLLQSLSCETLVNRCRTFHCGFERSETFISTEGRCSCFHACNDKVPPKHRAYKSQIAVYVVFHKAVDPGVVTQPPVTLTS